MCYNGVLVDDFPPERHLMDKAPLPTRISEDQIRKWQESVAQRRAEMFGPESRRRMRPKRQINSIKPYEELVDVDDIFGSTNLK